MGRALACLVVLAGCDTVDLGATPADTPFCRPSQPFFASDVWPSFLGKDYSGKHCYDATCHDGTSGGALNLTPPSSALAFPLDSAWQKVYQNATFFTECTIPRSSPILEKPDGLETHRGGVLISPTGPEVDLIVQWVMMP
jgi:hypothetical protein